MQTLSLLTVVQLIEYYYHRYYEQYIGTRQNSVHSAEAMIHQ